MLKVKGTGILPAPSNSSGASITHSNLTPLDNDGNIPDTLGIL